MCAALTGMVEVLETKVVDKPRARSDLEETDVAVARERLVRENSRISVFVAGEIDARKTEHVVEVVVGGANAGGERCQPTAHRQMVVVELHRHAEARLCEGEVRLVDEARGRIRWLPSVAVAAWGENLGLVVEDAEPVSKFPAEPREDFRRGVSALVVDRHDLIEMRHVRADRRLEKGRAVLHAHERADAGQTHRGSQVFRSEAIGFDDPGVRFN
jgi:hypothetical protein